MKLKLFFLLSLVGGNILTTEAQNPILKGYADPHMKIWNGRMYISVGKDVMPKPGSQDFFITPWEIYSSDDLMNWRRECIIDPADTYLGEGYNRCWASDISTRNGKYYFYFSNHAYATGVLVADTPNGPYKDVLGKPLIPKEYSDNHEYDPTVFIDDDHTQYIIFGRNGPLGGKRVYYQIARLSEDMISLAEKSRDLLTPDGGFGHQRIAQDHQYFHKHNGTYYLSCAGAYLTSDNVYGPFTRLRHTGQNGHSSFCEYNGQWYHMYEWSCEPYGIRQYRQVLLTYLHYKDNGDMVSDENFLQASNVAKEGRYYRVGVGNYRAFWDRIESEWFFRKEGYLEKKESPEGGFELRNIHNGDILCFPHIKGFNGQKNIVFRIASSIEGGTIEIRENTPEGKLLGKCIVPSGRQFSDYYDLSCPIQISEEEIDLCFLFKGKDQTELLRLNWFKFQ